MSKNHKGKLAIAKTAPTNIAAKLTITAFTDKPPTLECTVDLTGALQLLAAGMQIVANVVMQGNKQPPQMHADQVDKKREYLGPREG